MPQGINHSKQAFRNRLPLQTDYLVIVCYGICCRFPCAIWYLSACKNNKEHCSPALQFLLRALPVFKRRADESYLHSQSHAGSSVATPLPQATRLLEALGSSEQAPLKYRTVHIPPCRHSIKRVWATIWCTLFNGEVLINRDASSV